MNMETTVLEIVIEGKTKYAPAYILDGKTHYISHQDNLIYFDTKENAQEYLDDEY